MRILFVLFENNESLGNKENIMKKPFQRKPSLLHLKPLRFILTRRKIESDYFSRRKNHFRNYFFQFESSRVFLAFLHKRFTTNTTTNNVVCKSRNNFLLQEKIILTTKWNFVVWQKLQSTKYGRKTLEKLQISWKLYLFC